MRVNRGRRLGFDYGDVRIGVAASDPDSILSSPVTTLTTQSPHFWVEVASLLSEYEPIQVFVGRPIHLAGHESESAVKAEAFAQELRDRFDLEVILIDERLSTVSAQRVLKSAGVSSRDAKAAIDQMAAVEILSTGLEILVNRSKQGPNV